MALLSSGIAGLFLLGETMKKNNITFAATIILIAWFPLMLGLWDKDKPAATLSLRSSNPLLLANQSALEDALGQDHEFSTGGNNSGKHLQVTFDDPLSAAPATVAASEGVLYTLDVSSKAELHFEDEDENTLQITSGGDLYSSTGLTVTNNATFNGGITLGAGDDLIGSATSDITINMDKFTVAGATGNTVIGGTFDVTGNIDPTTFETTNGGFLNHDSMTGAADTSAASSDSIVKYATLDAGGVLMHDAEGGLNNCDVDGTKTKVYTKYLTGTLDANANESIAHGVTTGATKILSVTVHVLDDDVSKYKIGELRKNESSITAYEVFYDDTNIVFLSKGSYIVSNPYRIKIDYIL